jgi:hypothetical protein
VVQHHIIEAVVGSTGEHGGCRRLTDLDTIDLGLAVGDVRYVIIVFRIEI